MKLDNLIRIRFREVPREILVRNPGIARLSLLGHRMQAVPWQSCGSYALAGMLQARLELDLSEEEVLKDKYLLGHPKIKRTSVTEMASLTHHFSMLHRIEDPKVFMTNRGDIRQLRYLTETGLMPVIIHRNHYEGQGSGHFHLMLGSAADQVYFQNGAKGHVGFFKCDANTFCDQWWPVKQGRITEKWYLALPKKNERLPEMFKGKYM